MTEHAVLSASSSHRWLKCTPSARLELEFEDQTSEAAEEGTAAHAWCEYKLHKALGQKCTKPKTKFDCQEMDAYTNDYTSYVLEQYEQAKATCKAPLMLIEQHLDFSCYVPQGFGTGDCIIVADGKLHVIDFKYGQGVLVTADHNPQMMLYALGALTLFDFLYAIPEVELTIYQPRRDNVDTWVVKVEDLKSWAEKELKPHALLAFEGRGEYTPGPHCQFCKAKALCRARAEANLSVARDDFAVPPILTDEEVEKILGTIEHLTKWAEEIYSYAADAAINHGKKWQGFKLVAGKTNRKFTDEKLVAEAAREAGYHKLYRRSLITLTEMEKMMGKVRFNEVLGAYVVKPQGKLSLVPVTDKREEIIMADAKEDFKND